jgi:hypothetical protein
MDDNLPASEVANDLFRATLRCRLIAEMGARSVRIWLLDVPTPVGIRDNVPLVASWHRAFLLAILREDP